MRILDGRECFYQWDLNVLIASEDFGIESEVHFENKFSRVALVLKTKMFNGQIVVEVPNIMLQLSTPIRAYLYIQDEHGRRTIKEKTFEVKKRSKPSDYVYTPTEVLRYEDLEKRIENLENGGGTAGESGATFIPSVSEDGIISWTNDKDMPNPNPVNIKGANGKNGISATHSWNGAVLTITSASGTSSANLKGEKGDKGDRGEQGIQGIQGEKGDHYELTEEDKATIVKDVLNALPNGDEVLY